MTEKHLELSSFIKNVHENLRKKSKKENVLEVWKKHVNDETTRQCYAQAMHQLATTFWTKNNDVTRIDWVLQFCKEYFEEGKLEEIMEKETKRLGKRDIHIQCEVVKEENPKLLDVGSCYNPFGKVPSIFDVTAIDLSPATADVLQCDFLNLQVTQDKVSSPLCSPVTHLHLESYSTIVFSLLLEYLPSAKQRYKCCKTASELLKPNGLLFVITPDSKHQNRNVKMMKSWKQLMLCLHLVRVKYEKLKHLHCMAFRKVNPDVVRHLYNVEYLPEDELAELMFIPQDSNEYADDAVIETRTLAEDEVIKDAFADLPFS